jgi:PAS domain S-box-containing protein
MSWPMGGGEMSERIRQHDWASTTLGGVERWPQSLKTAVDLMLDCAQPVYITWGDENLSLFNHHFFPILGDKQAWALGRPYEEVWPELWEELQPMIEDVLAGRAHYFQNRPLVLTGRASRSVSWFTFSYNPLRDEHGDVRGMFCVVTDTTEKVLADKALIDSMDEGFAIFDTIFDEHGRAQDFRYVAINPAFAGQTGFTDAIGRTLREILPGLEESWFETFGQVVTSGEPARFTQESASQNKWFDSYAFRYGSADSNRLGLLFRDVTKTRQAEQALVDANRRKDEFLAMLAHELRNPLAPIAAGADLLKLMSDDPERVKRTGEVISRQVQHMTGLVDDLLDVSRVTRGQVNLSLENLNVDHFVQDAIEQVRPLIEARRHQLTFIPPAQPATVRGDSKRLVQIFANLLTNAAKYTPEGGRIRIAAEVIDDTVRVSVSDTGQGMEPAFLTQCFELFAQAERTTERAAGGLGIGLALVRSIVELHGGAVWAESDGLGKGSCFTVAFPLVTVSVQPDADSKSAADETPVNGRPLSVLVVDDNEDAAAMMALIVGAQGHTVMVENHPRQALDRISREPPDICLVDIGLPEMDGHELARRIRTRLPGKRPMLVAITGYGQPEDRQKALAAGFAEHLVKPVSSARIAEILRSLN